MNKTMSRNLSATEFYVVLIHKFIELYAVFIIPILTPEIAKYFFPGEDYLAQFALLQTYASCGKLFGRPWGNFLRKHYNGYGAYIISTIMRYAGNCIIIFIPQQMGWLVYLARFFDGLLGSGAIPGIYPLICSHPLGLILAQMIAMLYPLSMLASFLATTLLSFYQLDWRYALLPVFVGPLITYILPSVKAEESRNEQSVPVSLEFFISMLSVATCIVNMGGLRSALYFLCTDVNLTFANACLQSTICAAVLVIYFLYYPENHYKSLVKVQVFSTVGLVITHLLAQAQLAAFFTMLAGICVPPIFFYSCTKQYGESFYVLGSYFIEATLVLGVICFVQTYMQNWLCYYGVPCMANIIFAPVWIWGALIAWNTSHIV